MKGGTAKGQTGGKRIVVRQVRSGIARRPVFKATLKALGLGAIGKEREHVASPAILGMLHTVASVVQVREQK